MLKIHLVQSPDLKTKYFESVDVNKTTWVVSDLTTKLHIQKKIFEKQSVVEDESLLRASEFWKKIINRLRPDYKIVSHDSATALISQYLEKTNEEWMQRPGVPRTVLEYIQALSSVLNHENSHEIMKDFFKKNINSFQRWGHWYLLAYECYQELLERKTIISTCIPGILLSESDFQSVWPRDIVIDLGTQLLPVEAELLLKMSKDKKIDVLMPRPEWHSKYYSTLKSYEVLGESLSLGKEESFKSYEHKYVKVSTELSEVQSVVSLTRKLLDSKKTTTEKIAIVAPDIGKYWPSLQYYLNVEGIPFARSWAASNISFPEMQYWLARLKVENKEFDYLDLQTAEAAKDYFFTKFEKFKSILINLYSEDDLERIPELQKKYKNKKNLILLNSKDFFKWAICFWQENWPTDRLKFIMDKVFQEFSVEDQFGIPTWIEIIESFLSRSDTVLLAGFSSGIQCVDLISLRDLDVDYVFILGLTDENLRRKQQTFISESDISFIRQNYGFHLSEIDKLDLDFELHWNLDNKKRQYQLFFSEVNFDGNAQAPSNLWLKGLIKQNSSKVNVTPPEINRLTELQYMFLDSIREEKNWSDDEYKLVINQLKWDIGEGDYTFSNITLERASASQIEDYLKCPFIHASRKLFCLEDLPDLDLDIDYMTRGRLLHAFAEHIFRNHKNFDIDTKELNRVCDKIISDLAVPVLDKNFWDAQKEKYVKIMQKFIEIEKNWKEKFPAIKESLVEKDFDIHLCLETGEIYKEKKANTLQIRGRIDRLDIDDKNKSCVLIDYKYDTSKLQNYSKWIEKNQIQLGLYSYVVEKGGLEEAFDVLGAVYYGFKKLDRDKGFLTEEADGYMYSIGNKKTVKIPLDSKSKLYEALIKKIKDSLYRMKAGDYKPSPEDKKDCKLCKWKKVCRAPHLN